MIDNLIAGVVISLIVVGVPHFYKEGERKRLEHIKTGKIYYGFFRMIGLYILAFLSGEIILSVFLCNSNIDGAIALILTLLVSIPMTFLYLHLYRKKYLKIIEIIDQYGKEDK